VLKKLVKDYGFLFGVAGIVIVFDQWTKSLVRNNLQYGEIWTPWAWLENYARIVHWSNTGAAFGMFQHLGDVFRILAFVVSLAIIYYFPRVPRQDWPIRLAMALQLGGAVGNLIDRLVIGSVTDFISVGNFAIFNVADAAISVGVGVLLLGMWFKDRRDQAEKEQLEAQEQAVLDPEPPEVLETVPEDAQGE
jgi:signal peptidase II